MSIQRKYKGKDVDMLTTSQAITEQAIAHKDFLIEKRPSWAGLFFENHLNRIASCFEDILGIDNVGQQRRATQLVKTIHSGAYDKVSFFKVQVEEDFKKEPERRTEILKSLGFGYFAQSRRVQETMVQLLYQFKKGLTVELKAEILAKGTDAQVMDAIVAYADQLAKANVTQETLKGGRKEITSDSIRILNEIYDDTMSIAKIARKAYAGDKAKQDIFSYAPTQRKLYAAPAPKTKTPKKE